MSDYILEFETPLKEIEDKISSLKSTGIKTGMDVGEGIAELEKELQVVAESLGIQISENLQPSVGVAFLDHCVNLYNQSSAQ